MPEGTEAPAGSADDFEPAFTYTGDTVALVLHDSSDSDCVEEPVGGPFTVDGGPGARSHLLLTGSPGPFGRVARFASAPAREEKPL